MVRGRPDVFFAFSNTSQRTALRYKQFRSVAVGILIAGERRDVGNRWRTRRPYHHRDLAIGVGVDETVQRRAADGLPSRRRVTDLAEQGGVEEVIVGGVVAGRVVPDEARFGPRRLAAPLFRPYTSMVLVAKAWKSTTCRRSSAPVVVPLKLEVAP